MRIVAFSAGVGPLLTRPVPGCGACAFKPVAAPGLISSRSLHKSIASKWRRNSTELEEVDPMTGELISGTSMATSAPLSVDAGGYQWAYRSADIDAAQASSDKLPVICLHGIGSSSYAYRNLIRLIGAAGHPALAVDWLGHGASAKPTSGFDYTSASYISALSQAIDALPVSQPFVLVTHGYILGQFGMLWAAQNADKVAKLVILNTPLSLKSKLRPELAAYKAPLAFMRPKPDSRFDGQNFNAAGGPYAMAYKDACSYDAPYEQDPAASAAIYRIMENTDFPALLAEVDEEFRTWRNESLVIHGGADTFLDLKGTLDWLDSKRTCMRMATGIEAKVGHMPQEDFAEAISPAIIKFIQE